MTGNLTAMPVAPTVRLHAYVWLRSEYDDDGIGHDIRKSTRMVCQMDVSASFTALLYTELHVERTEGCMRLPPAADGFGQVLSTSDILIHICILFQVDQYEPYSRMHAPARC